MSITGLQAFILGLIQGITEFLPISSSGHLTLVPWILGWEISSATDLQVTFDTVLHLGTLLALVAYFWRDIVRLLVGWWQSLLERKIETLDARLAWLLILGSIPAAAMGYFLEKPLETLFANPPAISAFLLLTGLLLIISDTLGSKTRELRDINVADALVMGIVQGIAIAPGISRSGATLSGGLFRGMKRDDATRFSFLLGIPAIAGAAGFKLLKSFHALAGAEAVLALGFVAALISGYLVIRFFLSYVRTHGLRPFAFYCWAIGLLGLVLSFIRY